MSLSMNFTETYLEDVSSIGGKEEGKGPLASYFDECFDDYYFGEKSFEKAEQKMLKRAIEILFTKTKYCKEDMSLYIGGDLNNQIALTSKMASFLDKSYIGVYGACATTMLGLTLGAVFVEHKYAKRVLVTSSSHYGEAERQFRYPTTYANPKKETTTVTVTGAGAAIVSLKKSKIKLTKATLGEAIDVKWDNVNDMGSPMAYAAFKTITEHLINNHEVASDYDLILTGDLSKLGSEVLLQMMEVNKTPLNNHADAGALIFQEDNKKMFSGGSGAGCVTIVTFGYLIKLLLNKTYKRVLIVATGALHDPCYVKQKETIPVIAHGVVLEREDS